MNERLFQEIIGRSLLILTDESKNQDIIVFCGRDKSQVGILIAGAEGHIWKFASSKHLK